jgi:glycosyltransferase involved in cell wall biosynthesis
MAVRPRILHVIGQLNLVGGAEKQLFLLVKTLQDRYEFTVVFYDLEWGYYASRFQEIGVKVIRLTKDKGFTGRLRFLKELTKVFKDHSPDIIHTWLVSANFWGRLASILAGMADQTIVSIRNDIKEESNFPMVEKILDKILSRQTPVIISNTAASRTLLINRGIPASKIHVILNGIEPSVYDVDVDKDAIKDEMGIPRESILIGMIGRLTRQKNYDLFISMAKHLLNQQQALHFVIVGEGELLPHLEQMIEEHRLGNSITLTGSRKDIPTLLKAFDVFVLTSSWEGLPNVIMEAMCARVAVVATEVGGVPELIRNGINGIMVADNDLAGLVQSIQLLVTDKDQRYRLGEEGRRFIEEHFGVNRMAEETAAIYENLLQDLSKNLKE